MTEVKICGLSEPDTLRAAVRAGADYIGFVFVPASPRAVTPYAAASLMLGLGTSVPVALMVDPEDAQVDEIAALGFPALQLHGHETPHRVREIKERTGKEVWKAVGVQDEDDLTGLAFYEAADRFLIDAKPPEDAMATGGNGEAFDWSILTRWTADRPWLLAGGLTPENVSEAISATGAPAVDVSTGVERARGLKDRSLIEAFIKAAKGA